MFTFDVGVLDSTSGFGDANTEVWVTIVMIEDRGLYVLDHQRDHRLHLRELWVRENWIPLT